MVLPKKIVSVTNLLIKADIPTIHGRIYSADVLEGAVRKYFESNDAIIMGHIGIGEGSRTRMAKVSHKVHNLRINSQGIMTGEVEVLDTTDGKILQEMFDGGRVLTLNPSFSGTVNADKTISDDLMLNYVNVCYMPEPEHESQTPSHSGRIGIDY